MPDLPTVLYMEIEDAQAIKLQQALDPKHLTIRPLYEIEETAASLVMIQTPKFDDDRKRHAFYVWGRTRHYMTNPDGSRPTVIYL